MCKFMTSKQSITLQQGVAVHTTSVKMIGLYHGLDRLSLDQTCRTNSGQPSLASIAGLVDLCVYVIYISLKRSLILAYNILVYVF